MFQPKRIFAQNGASTLTVGDALLSINCFSVTTKFRVEAKQKQCRNGLAVDFEGPTLR
jgi:hypothetical protein